MQQTNGYFQIEYRGKEGFCHIFPPKDGGEVVAYCSLTSYLDREGFTKYDIKEINRAISSGVETCISVGEGLGYEIATSIDVYLSEDNMSVKLIVLPPSMGNKTFTAKDIMAVLTSNRVIYGIDQEMIMDLVTSPVYNTELIIASGKEPVQGSDAWVEYKFNTNPTPKPTYNEDGSVDFHSIDIINHVHKGDVIAVLHPEDRGKPGRNVLGKDVAPRSVNSCKLKVGRDITISADGLIATSEVTGQVRLYGDQIFVSNIYEIPADVDNSTGDIDFEGTVYVRGSIREGFKVIASEDVIVDGSVEGSLVVAGGQIVIKRGINGMFKGVLDAGGNVAVKFIENAQVFAKGYVETGSIIHGEVSAKGDVLVSDKKGFVTGGIIKSGGKIIANTVGSEMGAETTLEVGFDPELREKYLKYAELMDKSGKELQKLAPVIKTYADMMAAGKTLDEKNQGYYVKLLTAYKDAQETYNSSSAGYQMIGAKLQKTADSCVMIHRDIFPGVTVRINELSHVINSKRSFCKIHVADGEIKFSNM